MQMKDIEPLVAHMDWADAAAWTAVLQTGAAHGDGWLRERLHHIHTVQLVYLQIWRGEPIVVTDPADFPDLAALARWGRGAHAALAEHIRSLDAPTLDAEAIPPWNPQIEKRFGAVRPLTMTETIVQVVMHTTYHRGQVATRTRELGGEPPLTDFVAWLWQGSPPAAWPLNGPDGHHPTTA